MVEGKKNLIQFLLEKTADKAADSASLYFLFEPQMPDSLKEKKMKSKMERIFK